ncbi:MAG: hypothetical protein K9K66_15945 [Desulfarculaceae bacterium]|nr:hypothetical protein [Desulfarculaceae bacterium]MCF8073621.1 hypothetical protein [Desulfarculaceae bacterium]MCF8103147.1 hypothetical protein [Desulfarculaceae bacterium]MCF8115663.1 hypothetical protein [Desulfarculaceae bacterium]
MKPLASKTCHGWFGVGLFAFALAGSLAGVEWIRVWFYQMAWWGYIFLADALVRRKAKNSLIIDRFPTFLLMCLASAAFWFGWEMINLRLQDWFYVGVPPRLAERWAGAFIAYATVLPGILETYELLRVHGFRWGAKVRPIPATRAWYPYFVGAGALMLILPMVWPKVFFPLVWGALVFLLEPLNHFYGVPSLMRRWERGDLSPFLGLLMAGLICGAFWESWNWLAGARWVYNIPYLAEPKIFEMPLAGYLGFPPFAVECYVFFASLGILRGGRGWEAHDYARRLFKPAPAWLGWLLALGAVAFGLWMCAMIDAHLVKGWTN